MNKRKRGIPVSGCKVRLLLKKIGIHSCRSFEDQYSKYCYEHSIHYIESAPKNAYEGKTVDSAPALSIAQFLGQHSIDSLCTHEPSSWEQLVKNHTSNDKFFDLIVTQRDSNLKLWEHNYSHDDLDTYFLSDQWYLNISGEPQEQVLVLLKSDDKFVILSPAEHSQIDLSNTFSSSELCLPNIPISFKKSDGIGYREFIVVKALRIDFTKKSEQTNYVSDIHELDMFAYRLLDSSIPFSVSTYGFDLVDEQFF